ncbi:hypothetical protein RHSIM_Rhsim08G0133000 [Rhododendron simsii]|uniref:Ubiquitin-like protease family profile domain-containing protein n=1 Tax=Rhododendron simsii TaxID=118357 RepID=A0A834GHP5_RHOSS|nr:hypothetical protein RHSIM_Rhsim08G0133000 [Rhododendron simsii]
MFKKRDVKEVDNRKDALAFLLIDFDKEEMAMNVGNVGVPLIQSWTTNLIMERIAKEENLELVDPISGQFPQPCLLQPEAQKAYHTLQKSFLEQMQHIIIMDAALMGHVSETTTEKSPSKGKDVREMDSPLDDDACHEIPSSSTSTPKKARKGVAVDEIDEDSISSFENIQNAHDMPLYTPEHRMDDVVHTSIMDKCGSQMGVAIDQQKLNMEEEVQVQEEVVENLRKVNGEGEQVEVQVYVDGVVQERALTRPSKKRGNKIVKAGKATRTPYVAESEVKESKFIKEESQFIEYVMKPARKKEDMAGLISMDGMTFNPSRTDLQNVFKERGQMSNLVINIVLLNLCTSNGKMSIAFPPGPTPHLRVVVSVDFVGHMATCEHWFCVVINLVDKRIDVLDSMNVKTDEKTSAIADVVSALFNVLKRTRPMDYPRKNWIIHHPDVPQQNNMFMEHWTGGRMNTSELEANMGIDMRMRLLIRFILSPHNKRRDDVLQKCR